MKQSEQHVTSAVKEDIIRPPRPRALTLATTPDLSEWTRDEMTARMIALQNAQDHLDGKISTLQEKIYRGNQQFAASTETDPEIIAAQIAQMRVMKANLADLVARRDENTSEHRTLRAHERKLEDARYDNGNFIPVGRRW